MLLTNSYLKCYLKTITNFVTKNINQDLNLELLSPINNRFNSADNRYNIFKKAISSL